MIREKDSEVMSANNAYFFLYRNASHNNNTNCLHFMFQEKFAGVDIRVRVNGGGHVAQIYAIRQAISKALVSYYQTCK